MAVQPIPYPNVLGTSFAGIVEAVGTDVTAFQPGDRIVTLRSFKTLGDARFGAFQQYALASTSSTAKLPSSVPLEHGATTILNLAAVTSALHVHLDLDLPTIDFSPLSGKPLANKNKKVLIYGGTSSAGSLAIQSAAAAGYTVVTTSSPQHRAYVESLSPAAHIIDHTQFRGSLLAEIAAYGPYTAIFDTIGIPSVTNLFFEYLTSVGGGSYDTLIPLLGGENPTPANVQRRFAPYTATLGDPKHAGLGRWFYDEYLPRGLASGLIRATRPQVVEGGLQAVQTGLDLMKSGQVSGHKLVLYPNGKSVDY